MTMRPRLHFVRVRKAKGKYPGWVVVCSCIKWRAVTRTHAAAIEVADGHARGVA